MAHLQLERGNGHLAPVATRLSQKGAHDRHDEILDRAGDDLAEGTADDDGHRQVDDVPAAYEFLELFVDGQWFPL
jgi:hypothetical protein